MAENRISKSAITILEKLGSAALFKMNDAERATTLKSIREISSKYAKPAEKNWKHFVDSEEKLKDVSELDMLVFIIVTFDFIRNDFLINAGYSDEKILALLREEEED